MSKDAPGRLSARNTSPTNVLIGFERIFRDVIDRVQKATQGVERIGRGLTLVNKTSLTVAPYAVHVSLLVMWSIQRHHQPSIMKHDLREVNLNEREDEEPVSHGVHRRCDVLLSWRVPITCILSQSLSSNAGVLVEPPGVPVEKSVLRQRSLL